jgi:hypothetical protein
MGRLQAAILAEIFLRCHTRSKLFSQNKTDPVRPSATMSDPLSIASGIAGLVGLVDAVFTRIYQCYQYAKSVSSVEKEIKQLASGIMSLCQLLHGLSLYHDPTMGIGKVEKTLRET